MRQIILDTETTGIDPREGHRLIEIGAVEMVNRRLTGNTYHQYINPERDIEAEAISVHGITNERVADEPVFAEVADAFWAFIQGAELVIHNAPFDVGFLDAEFARLGEKACRTAELCTVVDTLVLARQKHPGQRVSLDALCKRYGVDNSGRELHGALLDARLLAEVYLTMTGGQVGLSLGGNQGGEGAVAEPIRRLDANRAPLRVIHAAEQELAAHRAKLDTVSKAAGESSLWDTLEGSATMEESAAEDVVPQ